MIIVDGSRGEGGGQILRTATALSSLTGNPCKIQNIRVNRSNPGLREQHLQGLLALTKLCNGRVENAKIGSTEIEFYPEKITSEKIDINIPTAGAITLVLQSLMIPAAFSDKNIKITIKGGATNTKWSPPIDYTKNIILPILSKMGYQAEIEINQRGFYPKGGAEVICGINPARRLKSIDLVSRGDVVNINGISLCSNLPKDVAYRQLKSAETLLKRFGYTTNIIEEVVRSYSAGSAMILWANCKNSVLGSDSLGEIKKSAEMVGKEAANNLVKELESGFALDINAADQVIPYMALANGKSAVTTTDISMHTLTNIEIAEKFLDVKFSVSKNSIFVEGCAFSR